MKDLQAQALRLEVKGKFKEAAKLYLRIGRVEKAAFLFSKAGLPEEGLRLLTDHQLWEKAGEQAMKMQRFHQAAEYLIKARKYLKAAEALEQGGDFLRAGQIFEREGAHHAAASCYLRAGYYEKAGFYYSKIGEEEKALMAYKRFLIEKGDEPLKLSLAEVMAIANLFEKNNDNNSALEILIRSGYPIEAVHKAMAMGEEDKALEIFLQHLRQSPYDLLASLDDQSPYLLKYGWLLMKAEAYPLAAMVFEKAERWEEAAQAHEKAGSLEEAAELYLKIHNPIKAAVIYEKIGRFGVAADLYYKQKQLAKAAENYEKDEDYYKAGRLYQFLGDQKKATALLQKIEKNHPEYMKALPILAKSLLDLGHKELAVERVKEALQENILSEENLTYFYNLAKTLKNFSIYDLAEKIFLEIAKIQIDFRDVSEELQELKAKPKALRASRAILAMHKLKPFSLFAPEELSQLWPSIHREKIKEAQTLKFLGDTPEAFLVLAKGKIAILSTIHKQVGKIQRGGDVFLLTPCFLSEPLAVELKALTPCALLWVPFDAYLEILKTHHPEEGLPFLMNLFKNEMAYFHDKSAYRERITEALVFLPKYWMQKEMV